MKILVTGASGFVGSKVLKQLEKKISKQDITLLSSKLIPEYKIILHNNYHLKPCYFEEQFDCLIHMGALTPKGKNLDSENKYIENIRTTTELFENLPALPSKIVFISSTSVYKENVNKTDEQSELTTNNMYALSKIVCEKFVNEFRTKGSDVQILRLGPVYGPGEEAYNKIAGTFLKKAISGENIIIHSDGAEKRNLLYVEDAAECICNAALYEKGIGIVNLVSESPISVFNLASLVIDISKSKSEIIVKSETKGRNDNFDASKMKRIFGKYGGFTSYRFGLTKLYEYFKSCEVL